MSAKIVKQTNTKQTSFPTNINLYTQKLHFQLDRFTKADSSTEVEVIINKKASTSYDSATPKM